jgi:hypothetical protein
MKDNESATEQQWLRSWEANPRDGPAVYIETVDTIGETALRGAWIDLTSDPDEVHQQIVDAVGAAAVASASWRIIDQVGVGKSMLPEDLEPAELSQIAIREAAKRRHPSHSSAEDVLRPRLQPAPEAQP